MFLKILKKSNQKGMSLVEVTMAVGLLGVAALGVMSLSENVSKSSTRAEGMVAKTQFSGALGSHINSTLGCEEFVGKAFSLNSASPTALGLTKWNLRDKFGEKVTALSGDQGGSPGTQFKHFRVKALNAYLESGSDPDPVIRIDGVEYKRSLLMVKATLSVSNLTNLDSNYYYSLPVLVDGGNTVRFCREKKDLREACLAVKGIFDEATGKCELEKTCLLKGTYQILSCSPSTYGCSTVEGDGRVNTQTGNYTCPAPSVANHTGTKSWTHEVSCGKKCTTTITNNMRWYSCLECPSTDGTPEPPDSPEPPGPSIPPGCEGTDCHER